MPTPILGLKNDYGDLDPVSASELNSRAEALEATFAGHLQRSVEGSSEVTLTTAEAKNGVLEITGALAANASVLLPAWAGMRWVVSNQTSGAYTLTVKTPLGTGVTVAQGKRALVYCDGVNVVAGVNDPAAMGAAPSTPQYLTLAPDAGLSESGSSPRATGWC